MRLSKRVRKNNLEGLYKGKGAHFPKSIIKQESELIIEGFVDLENQKDSFHYREDGVVARYVYEKYNNKVEVCIIARGEIKIVSDKGTLNDGISFWNGAKHEDFNTDEKLNEQLEKDTVSYAMNNWFEIEVIENGDLIYGGGYFDVSYMIDEAISHANLILGEYLKGEYLDSNYDFEEVEDKQKTLENFRKSSDLYFAGFGVALYNIENKLFKEIEKRKNEKDISEIFKQSSIKVADEVFEGRTLNEMLELFSNHPRLKYWLEQLQVRRKCTGEILNRFRLALFKYLKFISSIYYKKYILEKKLDLSSSIYN